MQLSDNYGDDRCVPEKQRSFGVSIQWLIIRLFGSIPGPVVFGAVIDKACVFWKTSCTSDRGACYAYDNDSLSTYFTAMALACMIGVDSSFALALCFYKPPRPSEDEIMITTTVAGADGCTLQITDTDAKAQHRATVIGKTNTTTQVAVTENVAESERSTPV